jgi:hypothetical protein
VPQFVMSRREFAGVVVIMATAALPLASPDQSRRVVALGRISRRGGQVVVSDRLAGPNAHPAVAGGGRHA